MKNWTNYTLEAASGLSNMLNKNSLSSRFYRACLQKDLGALNKIDLGSSEIGDTAKINTIKFFLSEGFNEGLDVVLPALDLHIKNRGFNFLKLTVQNDNYAAAKKIMQSAKLNADQSLDLLLVALKKLDGVVNWIPELLHENKFPVFFENLKPEDQPFFIAIILGANDFAANILKTDQISLDFFNINKMRVRTTRHDAIIMGIEEAKAARFAARFNKDYVEGYLPGRHARDLEKELRMQKNSAVSPANRSESAKINVSKRI